MAYLQARAGWQVSALASTAKELLEQLTHYGVSSKLFHVGLQQAYLQHAALPTDELAAIVQQSGLTQQQAEQGLADLLTALPPAPTSDRQDVSGRARTLYTVLAAATVRGANRWTCKAAVGILADSLQQLVPQEAQSFEQQISEVVEQLARATKQLLSAPCECSAHCLANVIDAALGMLLGTSGTAAHLHVVPKRVLQRCRLQVCVKTYASCTRQVLTLHPQSVVCLSQHRVSLRSQCWSSSSNELHVLLHTGTWSASLCDRLSLSTNMVLLNHQPADPQVGTYMLRMIAQALHVQLADFPLPEDSTQHIAARAATVNTQSAALMQPTDDVMTMGSLL